MAGAGRNWNLAVNAFFSVPIKAQAGPRSESLSLRGLHRKCYEKDPTTDATVAQQYRCRTCSEITLPGDLLKGFELSKGQYIPLTEDEIKAQVSTASDVMSLKALIPADQVDVLRRDACYYLGPQDVKSRKGASAVGPQHKAFELFRMQLERSGRLAVVTYSDRNHDKVGIIQPWTTGCLLFESYLDTEIPNVVDQFKDQTFASVTLTVEEEGLGALVFQSLFADTLDFSQFRDGFIDRVTALAMAKAAGKELPVITPVAAPNEPTDLLEALKASLAMQNGAGKPPAAITPAIKPSKKKAA